MTINPNIDYSTIKNFEGACTQTLLALRALTSEALRFLIILLAATGEILDLRGFPFI
jgi:hypothetical protein